MQGDNAISRFLLLKQINISINKSSHPPSAILLPLILFIISMGGTSDLLPRTLSFRLVVSYALAETVEMEYMPLKINEE